MKLLLSLTLLAIVSACSTKILLTTADYNLNDQAKFTAQFLKDKKSRYDIGLLALSTKEEVIAIKKEDLGCGKGTEAGIITKFIKIEHEPFLIISRTNFKEFVLVCSNPNFRNIIGNVYVTVKNIYSVKNGAPADVLTSDMKIELK